MRQRRWTVIAALVAAFVALSAFAPVLASHGQVHGINAADMDLSAGPRDDFYRFANGGWLDRTEIPGDEGAYGVFNELTDRTRVQLLGLLNDLAAGGDLEEGSDEWKAVELFRQGMDLDTRNARGIEPIQPILDEIDQIQDLEGFHAFQQGAELYWLTGLFWVFSSPDAMDSSVNAAYLSGPFLGLPNRDYYLEDNPDNEAVREAYVAVCAELLGYAGYDEAAAEAAAQAVYDLEHDLAEATLTREEQQDFSLIYNPTSIADLAARYPLMDWDAHLTGLGLSGVEQLIVTEPRYLEALEGIVSQASLDALKDFVKMEVFWSFADFLGEDVGETAFEFQGGVLGGVTEQRPLDERTLDQVSGMLGEAIGKLYVADYFPPEAKAQITALVEEVIAAFRARLEANTWMSAETKAKALEKLEALAVKVGYPDRWRSYEAVEIGDSFMTSFLNAANAETRRNLDQAGKPVDRSEWGIPPQVVNAFYNPFNNEIVFPAAILQPPFFDYQADPASNFGAIGFVIGHEITHGFDLQGSQFDAEGNLASWWTEEDNIRFDELNQGVVDQFGAIEVLPNVFVDGQITVTENVADLGGIQVAYDALRNYLAGEGRSWATVLPPPGFGSDAAPTAAQEVAGFTQEQRFFIAAASVWREKIREEMLRTQVQVDVHSPAAVRATQPLRNTEAFHEAFDIQPGDPMYLAPEERAGVW